MDATTAVAIAGIVVAGVVGPSIGAFWGVRHQGREHKHARSLSDLSELREVLDAASLALTNASIAMGTVGAEMHAVREGSPYPDEIAVLMREFWNSRYRLDGERLRVETRLGSDHPIVRALQRSRDQLSDAGKIFIKHSLTDEERRIAFDSIQESATARDEFVRQTRNVVESQLPARV